MTQQFWTLFFLSLISFLTIGTLFVLGFLFSKKLFFSKKQGIWLFLFFFLFSVLLLLLCGQKLILCCKDLSYVTADTYIEACGTVTEFTEHRFDYDGNGKMNSSKPRFYIAESQSDIVLYVDPEKVEVGNTYLIRYYPHTKICQIICQVA